MNDHSGFKALTEINMNQKRVKDLPAPAADNDAIRKVYIQDAVDKKHSQNTDTALGAQTEDLDMNENSIKKVKAIGGELAEGCYGRLGNLYWPLDEYGEKLIDPHQFDFLAFNILKGGSISFTPSPNSGGNNKLFDGTGSYLQWNNPSGDIVIEITLWQEISYGREFGIQWRSSTFPTSFKIEVFRTTDNQWHTYVDITGWDRNYYAGSNLAYNTTKIRITAREYNANYYQPILVFWWKSTAYSPFQLYKGGDTMYGDIDMNDNEIKNPANEADATLSGTAKLIKIDIGGTPYYIKAYPTKT